VCACVRPHESCGRHRHPEAPSPPTWHFPHPWLRMLPAPCSTWRRPSVSQGGASPIPRPNLSRLAPVHNLSLAVDRPKPCHPYRHGCPSPASYPRATGRLRGQGRPQSRGWRSIHAGARPGIGPAQKWVFACVARCQPHRHQSPYLLHPRRAVLVGMERPGGYLLWPVAWRQQQVTLSDYWI